MTKSTQQPAHTAGVTSLDWKRDTADYSWVATDRDGYVYRVARVYDGLGLHKFVTAWSETAGPRIGGAMYDSEDGAKRQMDFISSGPTALAKTGGAA